MEEILSVIGLSPSTVAFVIALILFFERIGKLIPDEATGIKGLIRKASKILGGYIENK
ncbi:hypothetical protein OAF54_00915 [bacterium]|nr:hypothetical protein [bacterium]